MTSKTRQMKWAFDQSEIDWNELSMLYRVAPLGDKPPEDLRTAFSNSMFKVFVFADGCLIGAGRALADGIDCSYLCDIAVHPDCQGQGLGKAIINKLKALSSGHRKIILYSKSGKEDVYRSVGFRTMLTAMAIFQDQESAANAGLVTGYREKG